jgi:hypothetical protein
MLNLDHVQLECSIEVQQFVGPAVQYQRRPHPPYYCCWLRCSARETTKWTVPEEREAVSSHTPLSRGRYYRLDELIAVLGEPLFRRNLATARERIDNPDAASWRVEIRPDTRGFHDEPVIGHEQVVIWRCPSGSCSVMGDPFADRWHARFLCHRHGGIPYELATAASDDDFARWDAWVTQFWPRLSELFAGIEQISTLEATCGGYRVQVFRPKPGASIMDVASVGCRSWHMRRSGTEKAAFSGNFSVANVSPRDAAPAVILLPLTDKVVELKGVGKGWTRGRVGEGDSHRVTLTLGDGSLQTFGLNAIARIRNAKGSRPSSRRIEL